MAQLKRPEDNEEGKLRRWVSNLQLESWQLELLITGFSIFLLATSIDQYAEFSANFKFNKLVATSAGNLVFVQSGKFIINTIPYALQFFLISLLVHLLLRGFWIGIVGLSSVSNNINLDKLNFKGPFRKRIPQKVRSLDDLIFYLDQVSSVIFAYTYLLAFSIISVVLVSSFLFSLLGISAFIQNWISSPEISGLIAALVFLLVFLLFIGAIIFFLDTLLFSAFKKSKWFSVLYYPIYRLFSVISLSFIYRSIYYHLITNYKKKQVISVTLVLGMILFVSYRINSWKTYSFYPEVINENQYIIQKAHYDDERRGGFIWSASIPSKFIKNDFLEVFIRYSPRDNELLDFLCPNYENLEREVSIMDGVRAGMKSARDSTVTIEDVLGTDEQYEQRVKGAINCLSEMYEIYIDGELVVSRDFFFTVHENNNERGIETVLDIKNLERGRHLLSIKKYSYRINPFLREEITQELLKMNDFVKISFWKE